MEKLLGATTGYACGCLYSHAVGAEVSKLCPKHGERVTGTIDEEEFCRGRAAQTVRERYIEYLLLQALYYEELVENRVPLDDDFTRVEFLGKARVDFETALLNYIRDFGGAKGVLSRSRLLMNPDWARIIKREKTALDKFWSLK